MPFGQAPHHQPLGATFWRIWSTQTVSTLGSAIAGFGIAVHVFLESGNALWLGVLVAAGGLPFVLLAPVLGRVDHIDRRRVMITGDTIAACGTVVALGLTLGGDLEPWHLVLVVAISAIGSAIQMPAAQAAVADLVERAHIDRANGLGQVGPASGLVLAPLIATMLVSQWGVTAVLLVDAVTFVIAVVATAMTPFRSVDDAAANGPQERLQSHGALDGNTDVNVSGWTPVFAWMRASGGGIAMLLVLISVANLCLGFFNVALVTVVASIDEQWAGLPVTVGGLSMMAAGIVIGRRGLPERLVPAVSLGVLMLSAGCAICGLRPSLAVVALGTAIAFAGVPVLSAASTTMLHHSVPAAIQGRMFALKGGIARALDPIGALVAGVVVTAIAEPVMSSSGALRRSVGRVLGTGDGRGAALVMILVGVALGMIALAARSNMSLRQLDTPQPRGATGPTDDDQPSTTEVGARVN
jgi:MFS family permease